MCAYTPPAIAPRVNRYTGSKALKKGERAVSYRVDRNEVMTERENEEIPKGHSGGRRNEIGKLKIGQE